MEINLKGRSAIVTGGSKGIGHAIATRFANSGADVAILARGREALNEAVGAIKKKTNGKVIGVQADVGNAADIQRAYNDVMQALGKVDILVNNAGTSRAMPFDKVTDEIMQYDLEQKLFAAIRTIRLCAPQMKERRWGRIINVLNIGAKAPRGGSAPTSVSRAAGMALTKALSHEFAPYNVLVNAMLVGLIEADQHAARQADQRAARRILQECPEGDPASRVGKAEEFANLACFLVSDAGSYITAPPQTSTAAVRQWFDGGLPYGAWACCSAFGGSAAPGSGSLILVATIVFGAVAYLSVLYYIVSNERARTSPWWQGCWSRSSAGMWRCFPRWRGGCTILIARVVAAVAACWRLASRS